MSMGASIRKGDAVTQSGREGPLDQLFGVHTDSYREGFVLAEGVRDEEDYMRSNPAVGRIDLAEELGGESVRSCLQSHPDLTERVYLNPNHDAFDRFSEFAEDDFAIQDADWVDVPEALIWESVLLAQLKSKELALAHFASDPQSVDFSESLDEATSAALAQRARQLAEELRNEALSSIESRVVDARDRAQEAVRETEAHLRRIATHDVESGDLSHPDLDKLFAGGQ